MICPNCGHENAAGYRFCNECGAKLPPVPAVEAQEREDGLDMARPVQTGPRPAAQAAPTAQVWAQPTPAPRKKRRGLYPFEIAALVIGLLWIALLTAGALGVDALFRGFLTEELPAVILFSTAVPAVLSLIPPFADAKGKSAPALAWVSFVLVVLFTIIAEMLVYAVLAEGDSEFMGYVLASGAFMLLLLVQSIRRLGKAR